MVEIPIGTNEPGFDAEALSAWMKSCELDRTQAYLTRGRMHGGLTDVDLIDRWKAAFHALVADPASEAARTRESELKSEIGLRGLQAPFEEVSQALDDLTNRLVDGITRLQTEDPVQLAACEREIAEVVDEFVAKKQSSTN